MTISLPILLTFVGCSPSLKSVTHQRVIPAMMAVPDLDLACRFGNTVVGGVSSISPDQPPEHPMMLAHIAAGMCAELEAREHKLEGLLALQSVPAGTARAAAAADHRIRSERDYAVAARRYAAAWQYTQDIFGLDCKGLKPQQEALYLAGLIAGDLALIADGAAGQPLGLPQNIILDVGRGASCLDDEKWWGVPSALQAAAWATVPGSGPDDRDPWEMLSNAAAQGDASGVSVARALQVFTSANAGNDDTLHSAILAHGAFDITQRDPAWVLLDEYARALTLFESDQIWLRATGSRTQTFGTLPSASDVSNPFGGTSNPFGDDPFQTPQTEPAPLEETP